MEEKGGKKKEQRENRKFNWLTPITHVINKLAAPNFANWGETGPPGVPAQPCLQKPLETKSHGQGIGKSCL